LRPGLQRRRVRRHAGASLPEERPPRSSVAWARSAPRPLPPAGDRADGAHPGGGFVKVSGRARRYEDRHGDPLDGLVNLSDLGIVLAVAFMLAALSSLELESVLTDQDAARAASQAANTVTATEDEQVERIELDPGERVVGSGREVGTVYRLEDGRTVIVRPREEGRAP